MAEEAPPLADLTTRVVILTGPVGSGKTTLLNSLLQARPSEERWAVLINDSGKTEVVRAPTSDVEVRTVFGACENAVQTGVPLRTALLQMLKRPRPQYLFVELSTIGQPIALQAMLQKLLGNVATVHAVIALVPQKTHLDLWEANVVYRAQLEQANVLAVHQCDDDVPESEKAGFEQCLPCGKRVVFWQNGSGNASTNLSEDVASAIFC